MQQEPFRVALGSVKAGRSVPRCGGKVSEMLAHETYTQSDAENYLAAAIGVVFGTAKGGPWAMIAAYFDESGTHDSSLVFVVAGLVSTPASWECLTKEWQQALSDEGVEEFHASECATGHGNFSERAGWSKDRRNAFYKRMTGIAARWATGRTWTAVIMNDYRQVFNEGLPYALGAMGCASRICHYSKGLGGKPFVPYAFEQGGKDSGEILNEFAKLRARERSNLYRMGPLTIGTRREFLPLQAADLHAYELYKYFDDLFAARGRKMRRSLWELLALPQLGGGGYLLGGEKLEQMLAACKEGRGKRIDIEMDKLDQHHFFHVKPPGAE